MKKLLLSVLFLSSSAFALEGPSLYTGAAAIKSQLGYTVQIGSPFFYDKRVQVQAQFFGMDYNLSSYQPYSFIELGTLSQFYKSDKFRIGFKSMCEFFLNSDLGTGMHFSLTGERVFSKRVAINLEAGYSYLFQDYFREITEGAGVSVVFGPKIYLY